MVNIITRTRKLRELLWIRTGPGALLLPNDITKISMEFARDKKGGHWGPRKFWRNMLPKIKYRNPAVSVEIKRHEDPNGPATLNIFTKAQPSTPAHSVDIRSTDESEILAQLVSRTNAMELKPTEQEEAELEELKEFKARSEADRALVREKFLKERREQELLKLARGEITAAA